MTELTKIEALRAAATKARRLALGNDPAAYASAVRDVGLLYLEATAGKTPSRAPASIVVMREGQIGGVRTIVRYRLPTMEPELAEPLAGKDSAA